MERNQVEQRFKWNTDDIFPSDEAWEKAYAEAEKEINFSQYAGKLGNRSDLLAFLKANDTALNAMLLSQSTVQSWLFSSLSLHRRPRNISTPSLPTKISQTMTILSKHL